MRSAFLIDPIGRIRAAASPSFPAGMVRIRFVGRGVEVAFHPGGVALAAFSKALRFVACSRPKRVALRLLPESSAPPVRIFSSVWEFAQHSEPLALPPGSPAPREATARSGASVLVSRVSFLQTPPSG